ncbi:MAG: hypothetical protein HY900_32085 [Deltaproteobacteria bacterium]|nr:hypothetical protein [Deltaproteobacteria bacterium]
MAKGFEDTFLYVYYPLLSANEVGGDPRLLGTDVSDFHVYNLRRAERSPHALNATATHDTKRGEDIRARLNVLSEIPDEWTRAVTRWRRLNAGRRRRRGGKRVPDGNDEYFLYQTLMGAWPFDDSELPRFRERLRDYLVKAVREAKVHTAWLKPDEGYEGAFLGFAEDLLDPVRGKGFQEDFLPFQRKVARLGIVNSLAQVLLKVACPGVPDFYQGTELWDLALVDPDNRRPVDFALRAKLLRELRNRFADAPTTLLAELTETPETGRVKLFLVHRLLKARRERETLFRDGAYLPIAVQGPRAEHVFAFARTRGGSWALGVVPRLTAKLTQDPRWSVGEEVWGETSLRLPNGAPRDWTDAVTGRETAVELDVPVAFLLRSFPVALLSNR